ncbi:MAG: hypothetical protein KBT88_02590 [Gammaproteobacteria bacterium]|nr:hypothetical protein [Gammaproteobacteria bacterium]MBQ0838644.1 hypothetical protein [Gammaproteobacteria bacterium]
MSLSATDLINNFEMYFDGSDMSNASLYLCIDAKLSDDDAQAIIETLRASGLWSADAAKTVPAEHKPMYAEQMEFIGYVSGKIDGKVFHASAYNHEKFPYNAGRWEEWKSFIAANY